MMDAQLKDIQKYLEKNGYGCVYVDNPGGDFLFIDIYIKGKVIRLRCTFPIAFPYEFPQISILEEFYNKYYPLPHIGYKGHICTFDNNKVFPNNDKPKEVTLETIKQAEAILTEGIEGINKDDFKEEISAYWELESDVTLELLYTPSYKAQYLFCYKRNDDFRYVSDTKDNLLKFLKYVKGWDINPSKFTTALYVPIENELKLHFPKTNAEIMDFLANEKYYDKYLEYLKNNQDIKIIIFSQRIRDSLCIFGWEHEKEKTPNGFRINNVNPLYLYKYLNGKKEIKKIKVNQLGHKRIFDRGGAGFIEIELKVSITGCGSIGSNLVKTLVDLGINDFTLIDDDRLSSENIARHFCGASYIRSYKSEAIKEQLIRHYADINCLSITQNVFTVINDNTSLFNEHDYNFIVVGNLPIERKFLSLFSDGKITKPLIIIWVEPYLMGGHAIIMQERQSVESLLFDSDFNFKYRVINDGDKYVKKEAGCQSSFLPYSAFEVQLFISSVVDYINVNLFEKKKSGNYLLSWGGRIDKARRSKMNINSEWIASRGRELKVMRLDNNEKI